MLFRRESKKSTFTYSDISFEKALVQAISLAISEQFPLILPISPHFQHSGFFFYRKTLLDGPHYICSFSLHHRSFRQLILEPMSLVWFGRSTHLDEHIARPHRHKSTSSKHFTINLPQPSQPLNIRQVSIRWFSVCQTSDPKDMIRRKLIQHKSSQQRCFNGFLLAFFCFQQLVKHGEGRPL